jgi:pimeloyl-ACP methyl ester carboxylesterase
MFNIEQLWTGMLTMPHASLKVIRPLIRLSSRIYPKITGKLAFNLFCTPVSHSPLRKTNPHVRKAQTLFARGTVGRATYGCGHVRFVRFEPEGNARGTVLLVHGWAGQGLFMAGFVEPLLAQGFRVLAMDLPAHGGSSGRKLTFPLAVAAVHAVVRSYEPLAGIVAHSFGGAVAMVAAAGGVPAFPAIAVDRVVTIAAPRAMGPYGEDFSRMLGLTPDGHAAFEGAVLQLTGRSMASFSSERYLRDLAVPTLLIHAPDDKEIPFSDAEAMAAAGGHVTLLPAPGLGHRRILFDPGIHAAAASFIAG